MPKDEFDFEDPMELNAQVLLTQEDTTGAMCECFIEEFMRMGYSPSRIESLFRNPHYTGMHLVWRKRGAQFVRDTIAELFARWRRPVNWPAEPPVCAPVQRPPFEDAEAAAAPQSIPLDQEHSDPMGAAIPKINL
jgi:hypothetical protein